MIKSSVILMDLMRGSVLFTGNLEYIADIQRKALQCRRSQGLSFAVGVHDLVSALAEQQDRYVFCGGVHHPVFVHAVSGI